MSKLKQLHLTAEMTDAGTYRVHITAYSAWLIDTPEHTWEYVYELPTGPRPMSEDVQSLLRMVATDLDS